MNFEKQKRDHCDDNARRLLRALRLVSLILLARARRALHGARARSAIPASSPAPISRRASPSRAAAARSIPPPSRAAAIDEREEKRHRRAVALGEPALFAGVNFDDATRLPADVAELPDGSTLRTRWGADAGPEPWHGFQLRSLSDLLHLEIRDARADAPIDDDGPPLLASVSVNASAVLQDAFLGADGTERDFELRAPRSSARASPIATARLKIKFHLQADVLQALARGVGLDVASLESVETLSAGAVCAAETLAFAKLGIAPPPPSDDDAAQTKKKTLRARKLELEERLAFKRVAPSQARASSPPSPLDTPKYKSMTSGVKRFLTGKMDGRKKGPREDANLVDLLKDAEKA